MKYISKISLAILLSFAGLIPHANGQGLNTLINKSIEKSVAASNELYIDLHQSPELSLMEKETSRKMADNLRELGFEVTTGIGGYGVVGVFKNGKGPVIMLRTDMDALPLEEISGLPWSSKVKMADYEGNIMPAMHACGHDMHMTLWLGTLRTLTDLKDKWQGTILAVAQPAEEISGGSSRMIEEGLFNRFPVPDYALAYHVSAELPAGTIGYYPGPVFAGVNSADITVFGEGGHGAMPHTTVDPVLLASRIVVDLQTIVSREIDPVSPAVVTVGSIHGGSKHNIIPEEVKLQLTLRFFTDEVYGQIKEALPRITSGLAISAGLPEDKWPEIVLGDQYTPPVSNDPSLVEAAVVSMRNSIGVENVIKVAPATVAEDFGKYGLTPEGVKIALFWCGSVNRGKYESSISGGYRLPGLHNPSYYPDFEPTYKTGVAAMSRTMIDLFNK